MAVEWIYAQKPLPKEYLCDERIVENLIKMRHSCKNNNSNETKKKSHVHISIVALHSLNI